MTQGCSDNPKCLITQITWSNRLTQLCLKKSNSHRKQELRTEASSLELMRPQLSYHRKRTQRRFHSPVHRLVTDRLLYNRIQVSAHRFQALKIRQLNINSSLLFKTWIQQRTHLALSQNLTTSHKIETLWPLIHPQPKKTCSVSQ